MNPLEYFQGVLELPDGLVWLPLVFLALCYITKLFVGRLLNGLILVNASTAIVVWVALDLATKGLASYQNIVFIYSVEAIAFALCLYLYRYTVIRARRIEARAFILNFYKYKKLIYSIYALQILIQVAFVDWDGSSRITYQTAAWFSPFRLIFQFFTPATVLLIFALASGGRWRAAAPLFLLTLLNSVVSGSKSGFAFTLVIAYLTFRDIYGPISWSWQKKAWMFSLLAALTVTNLVGLGVDAFKVGERLSHYAEATIMLLPMEDPTRACSENSTISRIHRGFGRFFGDPSSLNVDHLFGYSLMLELYGVNTFTGPNSRIGPYALCNFPSGQAAVLLMVLAGTIFLCTRIIRLSRRIGAFLRVAVLLLVIHLAQHLVMDYNTAMSDVTGILLLSGFLFLSKKMKRKKQATDRYENRNTKLV